MASEKRLIDANDVPKLFEKKYEETEQRILDGKTYLDTLAEGFTEADDIILSMPTVDAVEVVRCKDCIYYHKKLGIGFGQCSKCTLMPYPEDFCSYGERKEE